MIEYHSLFIEARFCPEVSERILRVIRHRGFELCSLNMLAYTQQGKKQIMLCLTVASNKSVHLLYTQLNKLLDINYIEFR